MPAILSRRSLLGAALAVTALPRFSHAADPIKIGMPLALTGPLGSVGQEMKNGAQLWAKVENAKGGLLGRPIELFITDTAGDPATCVRKAQELVERENCRVFFGMTLSSEALAVVPETRRVERDLCLLRQRRRQAHRRLAGAELLPLEHLRPDGNAGRVALFA